MGITKNKTTVNVILIIVFLLLVISFIILYFRNKKKRENFSDSIQVIYTPSDKEKNWEYDFMKNDICKNMNIVFVDLKEVLNYIKENPNLKNNHIFVFNSNETNYDELIQIVIEIKPLIIFHLSDEWGTNQEYLYLTSHTKLLFRQHNFKSYNIKYYNNIYHMPLGYMTGMLNGEKSYERNDISPITERKYTWSFIGNIKQDRKEMTDLFKLELPNYYCDTTTPQKMFEIYKDSVFVLNGRGNISVNCFRIYEAIIAGAIPVIVGDWDELRETFNFGDHETVIHYKNIPPFIYEKNWNDAVSKCKMLLNNTDLLEEMQKKVLVWWNNIVKDMRENMTRVIEEKKE